MKNALFLLLVGLVLVGFGCAESPSVTPSTSGNGTALLPDVKVEGVWHLAFNLPEGWVMVPQYIEDEDKAPTAVEVNNQMADVVLQSTDKIIALTGTSTLPEGTFVTDGYTYIRVFRMDKSTIIPAEAQDMGDGYSRLIQGVNATYYYRGEYANYKFVVYQDEQERSVAEAVITSAQEVTVFTTGE